MTVQHLLQTNLHLRTKRGARSSGVNKPISARMALRLMKGPIPESLPQSVIGNADYDMFGPNTYELSSVMPHNLDQMIGRHSLGVLYTTASALEIPIGFEPEPNFMGMTEPFQATVSEEAMMLAMALGDPVPEAPSEAALAQARANGQQLLAKILAAIIRKYGTIANYYKVNIPNSTNRYGIHRTCTGVHACNVTDPRLVFRCYHCGHLNCVDSRPPDEGKELFAMLKQKLDQNEKLTPREQYTWDKRGLDLHFMMPYQLTKTLAREHEPYGYPVNSLNDLNDKYFCCNCWNDLAYVYVSTFKVLPNQIEDALGVHMNGAFQLAELKKMGYTDTYRDMDPTTRTKIIANDYNLAIKVFAKLANTLTLIPLLAL